MRIGADGRPPPCRYATPCGPPRTAAIERRSALQRETLRKHRVLCYLVQQLQELQHLLQRIQSVSRLRVEPLLCLDGGRRHSKPLEAAFGTRLRCTALAARL